jgi:hypothetical protein
MMGFFKLHGIADQFIGKLKRKYGLWMVIEIGFNGLNSRRFSCFHRGRMFAVADEHYERPER